MSPQANAKINKKIKIKIKIKIKNKNKIHGPQGLDMSMPKGISYP